MNMVVDAITERLCQHWGVSEDDSGVREAVTDVLTYWTGFVLRPGDTLIVRVSPDISNESYGELLSALKKELPGVTVVVVVAEQLMAYRPEPS